MSDSIRKMMEATAARLPGWFVGVHPHFWSYLGEYGATYHVVLTLDAKTQVDAHGTSLPDVLAEAEAKAMEAMRRTDPPKDVGMEVAEVAVQVPQKLPDALFLTSGRTCVTLKQDPREPYSTCFRFARDVIADLVNNQRADAVREDRKNVAALAVSRVPSAPTDTTEGDPSSPTNKNSTCGNWPPRRKRPSAPPTPSPPCESCRRRCLR